MTRIALYPFMLAAALGLALSIVVHLLALIGVEPPGGGLVWSLHIGIFVVWLPTVLVSARITRSSSSRDFWKVALAGCPAWMKRTLYVLFAYAIVNFVLFFLSTSGGPRLTGEAPASVVRGFSGHWMVFYGAAFCTLYSAIHAPQLLRHRTCRNGHEVDPAAQYCPVCGMVARVKR